MVHLLAQDDETSKEMHLSVAVENEVPLVKGQGPLGGSVVGGSGRGLGGAALIVVGGENEMDNNPLFSPPLLIIMQRERKTLLAHL